ncbi:MAG: hypothetical protein IJ501_01105 [Bacilli bacterium]|nr:hypothetical protein [Bacilli bacterium]MBQ8472081.1 hypothetical protein [Bacilli bacterium]
MQEFKFLPKNYIMIIDEDESLLSKMIKDNFIYMLRKRKLEYEVYNLSIKNASILIDKYHLTEFPSVLFFKNNKLVHKRIGFCYQDYDTKIIA